MKVSAAIALAAALALWQTDAPKAERVNAEVAYIVLNCKLPEDADAQLHLVIAELLAGADEMKGEHAHEGAGRVVKALNAKGSLRPASMPSCTAASRSWRALRTAASA